MTSPSPAGPAGDRPLRLPAAPATLGSVADAAGVSRATVSRVMNGKSSVDPELARRVRAIAEELGYERNPIAVDLLRGRTQTIAVVMADLSSPIFQEVLTGISRQAALAGYRLLVAEAGDEALMRSVLRDFATGRCDGLVLAGPRLSDAELLDLAGGRAAVVLLDRAVPGSGIPSVRVDNAAGVRDLADHLLGLGHRRLAYLSGPGPGEGDRPRSASNAERIDALRAHLARRRGVRLVELPCGSSFADGNAAADAVLAAGVSAVLGYNDLVAIGLLAALHERGVDVPGELSVTGFDDIAFARYTTPSLTTVTVPRRRLGEEAWSRLDALLHEGEPAGDLYVHPALQVRGSTGPVPR